MANISAVDGARKIRLGYKIILYKEIVCTYKDSTASLFFGCH